MARRYAVHELPKDPNSGGALRPLTHAPRYSTPNRPDTLNRVQPKVKVKLWAAERVIWNYLAWFDWGHYIRCRCEMQEVFCEKR